MTSWIFSLKFIHAITSYNCIIFGDNDWNYHSLNTSSNETWVHLRICSSIRPFCRLSIRSPSGLCPFVHPCRISFVFSFVRSSGSREGWWSESDARMEVQLRKENDSIETRSPSVNALRVGPFSSRTLPIEAIRLLAVGQNGTALG